VPRHDAVLLDAGNTLVFVDAERVHREMEPFGGGLSTAALVELEREARLKLSRAMGETATGDDAQVWRDYFLTLISGSGVPPERMEEAGEALKASHERDHMWTRVQPGTHEALQAVLDLGYRVAVVSNADGRVEALLREQGFGDYLEFVVDSQVVGIQKPDPRIFQIALKRLQLPAERVLYVGDLPAVDVIGSRRAGLDPLLLDPFDVFGHHDDVPRIPSVLDLPDWLARLEASPHSR